MTARRTRPAAVGRETSPQGEWAEASRGLGQQRVGDPTPSPREASEPHHGVKNSATGVGPSLGGKAGREPADAPLEGDDAPGAR